MGKLEVITHPLIQHKLSILRRTDTSTKAFRELVDEIAMLMGYEVLRELPLEDVEIETPITKTVQKQIAGKKLAIDVYKRQANPWSQDAFYPDGALHRECSQGGRVFENLPSGQRSPIHWERWNGLL